MQGFTFQLHQSRSIKLTSSLRQAIEALGMSNQQFSDFLLFRARLNPFLELQLSDRGGGAPARSDTSFMPGSGADDGYSIENISAAPAGLLEHIWQQVPLLLKTPREFEIAEHLVAAIEPTGWLGQPLEEIAREAEGTLEEAEDVLHKLQQVEPAGLFARNLAECLRLQAVDADVFDPVMEGVLANLQLIAEGRLDHLAEICDAGVEDVAARLHRIRRFDPKPGAAFGDRNEPSLRPDLTVFEREGEWVVDVRNPMVRAIRVRSAEEIATSGSLTVQERELLQEARSIQRAAERRDGTMVKVAAEIVRRQEGFLRQGPAALLPLRLADIADTVGVHASTVSRITSDRHIETPRGILPLRSFFSVALNQSDGATPVSAAAVREDIRRMISAEDKDAPLSDQDIARNLNEKGLALARRTVTKYRVELGLASSTARRRACKLQRALKKP
ncbi:RNA polymerase factor sigma-54 [Maritimibacter sp. HL-12]|uniref:RNA polymerase factor sigma-54 n=1 Tax=Maritimibacter sp. HL-12 TaxID=1162418 RepID=UPI000A0F1DA2|nr:RNA polymerase factor sigma-54 [Maritimibacter sp. HL-12]SMH38496.1 RNA polymerase, sigma 54 subunit, RpoN/SigL [Maritimibacter sp. HL-12]